MKEEGDHVDRESDEFKEVFKYYKSKHPPPSLSDLIYFSKLDPRIENITRTAAKSNEQCESLGLTDMSTWKVYALRDHPGLLYLTNPFTAKGQRYWIRRCLQEYSRKPNKTNLDNEINLNDWWSFCNKNAEYKKKYLKKLRWTTLGYHHDWNTKVYKEENRGKFPDDLTELCDVIAHYLGYNTFEAQAAIVNYYHMDSTLSPHTDHSEENLEAPLISVSFGQSAIFLLGGRERSRKPSALLLRSGDVVVMSRESRLSYHAVPKVLQADRAPWDEISDDEIHTSKHSKNSESEDLATKRKHDIDYWDDIDNYIKYSRINLNVRQVLNENQNCLTDR